MRRYQRKRQNKIKSFKDRQKFRDSQKMSLKDLQAEHKSNLKPIMAKNQSTMR